MRNTSYTAADVAIIREMAPAHTDPEIAARLGWPKWKAQYVRQLSKIEPFKPEGFWTADRIAQLRQLLVVQGVSSNVIAERWNCNGSTIRKAARKHGFVRNPAARERERLEIASMAGLKGSASRWAGHVPTPRVKPLNTHRAPVNFKAPEKPATPLPERITAALRSRAMSAPSLASVLGEKELHVGIQLAALAHAGAVLAGPATDIGPRHRIWRLAA